MIDANEMRDRFDRAYAARLAADHTIPMKRGVWLSLYEEEGTNPVQRVGAGAGLTNQPIAKEVPLGEFDTPVAPTKQPNLPSDYRTTQYVQNLPQRRRTAAHHRGGKDQAGPDVWCRSFEY